MQTSVWNNIHTLSLTFEDGETIETTGEHPFYVEGEGFTPAGRLAIGNAIVTRGANDAACQGGLECGAQDRLQLHGGGRPHLLRRQKQRRRMGA